MSEHNDFPDIEIKYRTLGSAEAPAKIVPKKPGWAGTDHRRQDGSQPQPWHCRPFVEGSTYGLELLYPYKFACTVTYDGFNVYFDGDFGEAVEGIVWPPFRWINPGHYSMATSIDIEVPEGWCLRTEAHPRFYTDFTGECPIAVPGHLRTSWWPMYSFVTFKCPMPGRKHLFRPGEAYAQVLVVPADVHLTCRPMSLPEQYEREAFAKRILRMRKELSKLSWTSDDKIAFDDLYKQLRSTSAIGGIDLLKMRLEEAELRFLSKDGAP